MSKVHSVLLIPQKGDPHGLLKEGVGGMLPPMAHKVAGAAVGFPYESHRWRPGGERSGSTREALVLAWAGEISEYGCLLAVGGVNKWREWLELVDDLDYVLHGSRRWVSECLDADPACKPYLLGTLVHLDDNCKEVKPWQE